MRGFFWIPLLLVARAFSQPSDGSLQRPDLTLHYTCVGTGEPLLILSGGPGLDVSYMQELVGPLSKHNRCILLEQRGTGRSKPAKVGPDTYLMESYVQDVDALRQSIHLNQLNILGHSWGGMLAMSYAAKFPARVHSLVLLSSAGMDLESLKVLPITVAKRLTKEDIAAHQTLPAYFYDRKKGLAFAATMTGSKNAGAGLIFLLVAAGLAKTDYDVRVGLTAYHGPAFISQGREDVVGDDTATQIHDTIYCSQLQYIDQCGHFEWLEKPNVLLPPLEAFLAAYASSDYELKNFPVGPFGPEGYRFVHHWRG